MLKALLAIQSVSLYVERLPTARFSLGCAAFVGSVIAVSIPCIELVSERKAENHMSLNRLQAGLVAVLVAMAFFRGLFCILLPRRPAVFWEGKVVDKQETVSALSRYTFTWADELLAYALRNRNLQIDDLPALSSSMRAQNLSAHYEATRAAWPKTQRLWKLLGLAHWPAIALELTLTLILCFLSFGPQLALYGILTSLETYGLDSRNSLECWGWVLALGALMLLASALEAWLFWIVFSKIYIPLYEEMSAVTFSKAMGRKDVKQIKSKKKPSSPESADGEEAANDKPEPEQEQDESDARKNRQSVINLIAIDARRVADYASFLYMIPSAIIKIVIACIFLSKLIGLTSLLSGLVVSAVVTPANWYVSKKFSKAQDDLMKARDQKMATITEVLQGIRQVKFSALESQWQQKIGESRNRELDSQWATFFYDICLVGIWILGPLMLSAVSLAVYAVLNGGLSASVAFTTISVFGALEVSMSILPEMISFSLEATISVNRIEKYLNSPDRIASTVPADEIAFEDATIAWPMEVDEEGEGEHEAEEEEGRFTLQDLSVAFPMKGLSVISGRTGSGKSLLLSSILGESDVLKGTVKVPTSPSVSERFDHLATAQNWLIDSAIAYVAQIPWIENATIRNNILFGLPFDLARYQKVLFACALEKDIEMLTDGELTDIGANGVNISGGQKWRISFARALYSRAGILVMDDIFSALDAHTGRHLYEHALTGELGSGRTRILVTHHVGLCLPRTDYSVLLADGLVKHAGATDDLRKSNSLADILSEERSAENAAAAAEEDEEVTALERSTSNKKKDPQTDDNVNFNTSANGDGVVAKDDSKPRKFVQDEKRETGSIKLAVYTSYLKKGGGIPFWGLVVLAYVSYVTLLVFRVSDLVCFPRHLQGDS